MWEGTDALGLADTETASGEKSERDDKADELPPPEVCVPTAVRHPLARVVVESVASIAPLRSGC